MLDRLERIFGRLAVPNLALYIVIGQVFVLLSARVLHLFDPMLLVYAPVAVQVGHWWRPFTFLFVVDPSSWFGSPLPGYILLIFGWQLFYLMGGALEQYWGTFRFNVYLLLSWFLTVLLAFLTPHVLVENTYILLSVFLAFAYLNPEFELLLMFILPVKIKWLAMLTWAFYAAVIIIGGLAARLQIAAPVVTFALFFGADILRRFGLRGRPAPTRHADRPKEQAQPRHVCHVCGKTDVSHPELDFRYCSKCVGDQCYCPEHIQNHAHVVAPESES
jgi:ribosomal protein L37AE/L43A